jgi:HSP20 family protein
MRYLRHEFSVEHFRQTVMLPEDIHKEQISAKVENGILDIVIPKVTTEEKKQAVQTIEVC